MKEEKIFLKELGFCIFMILPLLFGAYASLCDEEVSFPLWCKIISVVSTFFAMLVMGAGIKQTIDEFCFHSVAGFIFRLLFRLLVATFFFAVYAALMKMVIFQGGSWVLWILILLGMMAVAFIPMSFFDSIADRAKQVFAKIRARVPKRREKVETENQPKEQ